MLTLRLASLTVAMLAAHGIAINSARPSHTRGETGRPVVLVVHGRGQFGRDSAQIRRDALHALQNGANALMGTSLLEESDVRLVWYADLLDARSRGSAPLCAHTDSLEQDASLASEPNAVSVLAGLLGALLDAASSDSTDDETLDARRLGGDLHYLADPATRCAARQRVSSALRDAAREGRPVILVAHSFGSFVAWDHLRLRTARGGVSLPEVHRFITVGSPLGSTELRQLVFGEDSVALTLPTAVDAWTNVLAAGDPFASRITERDSTGATVRRSASILDVSTQGDQDDPHLLVSYLHDTTTARVVLSAWCDAYVKRPRAADASCASLTAASRSEP
ncbi:MAG: hypothetical protein ABJE10_14640 [bacterium]